MTLKQIFSGLALAFLALGAQAQVAVVVNPKSAAASMTADQIGRASCRERVCLYV